jgi:regulator of RNase E activity RraA
MLADLDGVIRVPRRLAREVADRAIEAMGTENRVRTAILAGTDPVEAYLKHGKF